MNYTYDIMLNFNKKLYDFYDWNKKDNIIHIKKIPSFKINDKDFENIKKNIIKINSNFLQKILGKTEKFKKNDIYKIKYASLFSNGKEVLAIKWNKGGINIYKSTLYIESQDDIIEIINRQKEIKLNYKIIKKEKLSPFKTRFEIENQNKLKKELSDIYKNQDYKKMSYIYLECFEKRENNIEKAYYKLKKEIAKTNDNFYKIYNFFKIINQK